MIATRLPVEVKGMITPGHFPGFHASNCKCGECESYEEYIKRLEIEQCLRQFMALPPKTPLWQWAVK